MITHIRMKNFKSWKDSGEVKLAPLTGFFGTNSSGKSSLLQMLLLLKQTVDFNKNVYDNEYEDQQYPYHYNIIFFGNMRSLVNLGGFKELIHNHEIDQVLKLEIEGTLSQPSRIDFTYNLNETLIYDIERLAFNTVIRGTNYNSVDVDYYRYADPEGSWNLEYKKSNDSREPFVGDLSINGNRIGRTVIKSCYGKPPERDMRADSTRNFLFQTADVFEGFFSNVFYLGPSRVTPHRDYNWKGNHPTHPGEWGNRVIEALLSARVRNLKTSHDVEDVPIEHRISYWLQKMELAYSFTLNWKGETKYEVRIQKTSSSPPVTLVDMGYGLSQFLPVLVLCYYVAEGSTLILEQPGIHLHPKVQSQLADLLIEVVNERKLQILVESHSEHLLTRIQRRIVENQIESNDVALYFCRNDGDASTIDKLDVDEESGDIKNWPENFFGDVMGDMFAMTDKQVERIAENEPEE